MKLTDEQKRRITRGLSKCGLHPELAGIVYWEVVQSVEGYHGDATKSPDCERCEIQLEAIEFIGKSLEATPPTCSCESCKELEAPEVVVPTGGWDRVALKIRDFLKGSVRNMNMGYDEELGWATCELVEIIKSHTAPCTRCEFMAASRNIARKGLQRVEADLDKANARIGSQREALKRLGEKYKGLKGTLKVSNDSLNESLDENRKMWAKNGRYREELQSLRSVSDRWKRKLESAEKETSKFRAQAFGEFPRESRKVLAEAEGRCVFLNSEVLKKTDKIDELLEVLRLLELGYHRENDKPLKPLFEPLFETLGPAPRASCTQCGDEVMGQQEITKHLSLPPRHPQVCDKCVALCEADLARQVRKRTNLGKTETTRNEQLIHGMTTPEEERAKNIKRARRMLSCNRPSKKEFTALKDVLKKLIPERLTLVAGLEG